MNRIIQYGATCQTRGRWANEKPQTSWNCKTWENNWAGTFWKNLLAPTVARQSCTAKAARVTAALETASNKEINRTGSCCGTTTGKEGNVGKDFARNPPDLDLGPNIGRAFLTISFHAKPTRPNKSAEQISIKNGTGMHRELWILSSASPTEASWGDTAPNWDFLGKPLR